MTLMSGLLELRPAHPRDAEFLAWGLDEAAGGLFSTMLGGRSTAILASVVAQTGHPLSYEHAVLAAVDGQGMFRSCNDAFLTSSHPGPGGHRVGVEPGTEAVSL